MDTKKIKLKKYIISDNQFAELIDNLETKVPDGYITIEGKNASREKEISIKNSK